VKRLLFWIALLGLFSSAHAADFGISVDSPYLVTDWCIGKDLDIRWTRWGDWSALDKEKGNRSVRIVLVPAGGRARSRVISEREPAHVRGQAAIGRFSWTIPGDVDPGEYHVRVTTLSKLVQGESEVFTIKSCQPMLRKEWRKDVKPPEFAVLVKGRIGGRVYGFTDGHLISGRRVRVVLKRAGAVFQSAECTLDAAGSADYLFAGLLPGAYGILVEKVASAVSDPAATLNVCFDGTMPASRTVTIASGSAEHLGQDFAIQYTVAFNMSGLCW